MRNWRFNLIVGILVTASLTAMYFVLVNTVFSHTILANVEVQGQIRSLIPEAQAKQLIAEQAGKMLPQFVDVKVDTSEFTVAAADLNPRIDFSSISSFGKGNDLGKVLGDSLEIISGKVITNNDINFALDPDALLAKLPYKSDSGQAAFVDKGILKNCQTHSFHLDYDRDKLITALNSAIKGNKELVLNLKDILVDPAEADIIPECADYLQEIDELTGLTNGINTWESILVYNLNSNNASRLELQQPGGGAALTAALNQLADKVNLQPKPGAYTQKDQTIYLYQKFQQGRQLDINTSIKNLSVWLSDPQDQKEILSYIQTNPAYFAPGTTVVDLTKKLGEGDSRLDIIRGGMLNYRVGYAQAALQGINDMILEPGQEFSFIRDSGIKSGRTIAGIGTCNATTTLFRAALLAGFPVTDRSPHTSYIWSYEYPFYPINNVEATFFGGPVVDLKFVNDLDKPVLLHFSYDRTPNDGFQYHKVEVFSSPDTPTRTVDLTNFKKWNVKSDHFFQSSFDRQVWVDGKLTRQDTWSANYYN